MRISISNLAWDPNEDAAVADLLKRHGIDAIDVAPGKYFPDPAKASDQAIAAVAHWWRERGIEVVGMQALLFGTTGLNLFGDDDARARMLEHLGGVCRVASGLGARWLVFGSPKNRDRSGLGDEQALERAISFFRRLGDIAAAAGVVICLEPNPPCYGANFMTTHAETAGVVRAIGHPAIRMQMDTGALTIGAEPPTDFLAAHADLVGHVHASEPNLVPLGDGGTDHAAMAAALRRHLPAKIVAIEMLATKDEAHAAAIERALRAAVSAYGGGAE